MEQPSGYVTLNTWKSLKYLTLFHYQIILLNFRRRFPNNDTNYYGSRKTSCPYLDERKNKTKRTGNIKSDKLLETALYLLSFLYRLEITVQNFESID